MMCSPRFNPSTTVWEHPWLLKSASVSIVMDTRITCMLCDYLHMYATVCMQECIICVCVAISGFLFVLAVKFNWSKSVTLVSSCCLVKLGQLHFSKYFNIKRSEQITLLCGVLGVPSLTKGSLHCPQMGVPEEDWVLNPCQHVRSIHFP